MKAIYTSMQMLLILFSLDYECLISSVSTIDASARVPVDPRTLRPSSYRELSGQCSRFAKSTLETLVVGAPSACVSAHGSDVDTGLRIASATLRLESLRNYRSELVTSAGAKSQN